MSARADIGVVITTHNYGHYLTACLESVLSQTLLPCQVVVVDDASEDNAADVAASFSDVRIAAWIFAMATAREILVF